MSTTSAAPSTTDRDWRSVGTAHSFEAVRQSALADCADLIDLQRRIVAKGKDLIATYEQSQGE